MKSLLVALGLLAVLSLGGKVFAADTGLYMAHNDFANTGASFAIVGDRTVITLFTAGYNRDGSTSPVWMQIVGTVDGNGHFKTRASAPRFGTCGHCAQTADGVSRLFGTVDVYVNEDGFTLVWRDGRTVRYTLFSTPQG
jgi:hypothetical protein